MKKAWEILEKIIHFFLYQLFRLKLTKLQYEKFLQFVQFTLVGVSNAVVYYSLYLLFLLCGIHYEISNFCSFSISVLNSFYWNSVYVFHKDETKREVWWKVLAKTYISYAGTGLLLGSLLLAFWVQICCFPESIGPILNIFVTTPLNFLINKFWAYKGKGEKQDAVS